MSGLILPLVSINRMSCQDVRVNLTIKFRLFLYLMNPILGTRTNIEACFALPRHLSITASIQGHKGPVPFSKLSLRKARYTHSSIFRQ